MMSFIRFLQWAGRVVPLVLVALGLAVLVAFPSWLTMITFIVILAHVSVGRQS
jgi:hypothetical protein